jgi:acetylornithine deacetylase
MRDHVVNLLRSLVGFDTTSAKSNMALIEFIVACLRRDGVSACLIGNDDGSKSSLLATIGPPVPGGIVLSGHTDVVPVTGQDWHSDPFRLTERGARLHGRGTADMKTFIAVVLAMVPLLTARRLRVPVHLALSYDEEVGCLAAPALIARLQSDQPKPALAIIGEPSDMNLANAHRGISTFVTAVRGRPGHAGAPSEGVNAIACAAECITFLSRLAEDMGGERGASESEEGNGGTGATRTTINVGTIAGGEAVNIIAEHCRFAWECRPAADHDAEAVRSRLQAYAETSLLPAMRRRAPHAAIVSEAKVAVPPLGPEPGCEAERIALALAGKDACDAVPFASEAGLFQRAGIPAFVCGPGSFLQAHQPDEFVTLDQIDACIRFMRRVADWAERRNAADIVNLKRNAEAHHHEDEERQEADEGS